MHSSISSSERSTDEQKSRRSIWWLLTGLVIIGIACEALTTFELHRASRIFRRIEQEYNEAASLRPYSQSCKPTVVLLGDSLLLEGIDYSALKLALADKYDFHRLVFEQTEYLEQYYTLRTLLRRGSRPHTVVLCTSVNHLVGDDTRGEFMARYIDVVDIAALELRQHAGLTTMSNNMFAHESDWYANRAEIRKFLLGRVMPDVQNLTRLLANRRATPVENDEVQRRAEFRLQELKSLCDQYNVKLLVLIPPAINQDQSEVVVSVGQRLGLPVLVPEHPGALGADFFRDDFHLNASGARVFTSDMESQFAKSHD